MQFSFFSHIFNAVSTKSTIPSNFIVLLWRQKWANEPKRVAGETILVGLLGEGICFFAIRVKQPTEQESVNQRVVLKSVMYSHTVCREETFLSSPSPTQTISALIKCIHTRVPVRLIICDKPSPTLSCSGNRL